MTDLVERFAAFPETTQAQLLRLPALAAEMSAAGRAQSQGFLVAVALHTALIEHEDLVPTAAMMSVLVHLVKAADAVPDAVVSQDEAGV